jgi:hypothetical protein
VRWIISCPAVLGGALHRGGVLGVVHAEPEVVVAHVLWAVCARPGEPASATGLLPLWLSGGGCQWSYPSSGMRKDLAMQAIKDQNQKSQHAFELRKRGAMGI